MGASIDIIGNEDKIETDLSMCYSSASWLDDYMRKHNILEYNEISYPKNQCYDYKTTYKREELERLVQIAEKEKEDERIGIWNIRVALLNSKSKTFTITYWGGITMKKIYYWIMKHIYAELLWNVEKTIHDIESGNQERYETYKGCSIKFGELHT